MSEPRSSTSNRTVDRETGRWFGVGAFALLAGGFGIFAGEPALLLAGSVGVAFVAYAGLAVPPSGALAFDRRLDPETAAPGDEVTVTATVTNVGDSVLPDIRLIDGVPDGLEVVSGSPRLGTALRPGRSATVQYAVEATRGNHLFDPPTVLLRGFSGAVERERELTADEPTTLTCVPTLATGAELPLRSQTTPYTGRVPTDSGGPGTEFHAVRDYRSGDPISRIHWRRAARTGEFATVEYRQERSATVVLVVDSRDAAYVGPPGGDSAVERSVAAAGEAFTSLTSSGDRVGIAAYGPEDCWLPPGTGSDHRARARTLLATDEAFSSTPSDEPFFAGIEFSRLQRRLSQEAQIVLFSPIADDYVVTVARRLDAYGHRVTVVSPDPTDDGSPGRSLARAERSIRLSTLRGAGIRVVDWGDEPLASALVAARRRWSA